MRHHLSASRARRLRQALKAELRLWLHTIVGGAAVTFVLWTVAHLALSFLQAPAVTTLDALTPLALPWAATGAAGLLAMFIARGVAIGLADSFLEAEERARAVMTTAVAVMVALAATAALTIAWPARAATPSLSAAEYCARELGAWFYCARPLAPVEEKSAREEGALQVDKPAQIIELEAFQKEVEEARQIAVWAPTEENVRRFYLLQKVALDRGGLFADQWRRLVWTNPELDYTLKRPVSEIGKRAWEDERLFDRELFLKAAGPQLGLFYVFRETCGACRVFSPIVKAFSGRYSVSVKAIGADGGRNPDFQDAVPDKGQLKAWGFAAPATPALLIFQKPTRSAVAVKVSNGKTVTLRPCAKPKGCLTYLGAGVMSVEDIAERMFVLLATEPGQDF